MPGLEDPSSYRAECLNGAEARALPVGYPVLVNGFSCASFLCISTPHTPHALTTVRVIESETQRERHCFLGAVRPALPLEAVYALAETSARALGENVGDMLLGLWLRPFADAVSEIPQAIAALVDAIQPMIEAMEIAQAIGVEESSRLEALDISALADEVEAAVDAARLDPESLTVIAICDACRLGFDYTIHNFCPRPLCGHRSPELVYRPTCDVYYVCECASDYLGHLVGTRCLCGLIRTDGPLYRCVNPVSTCTSEVHFGSTCTCGYSRTAQVDGLAVVDGQRQRVESVAFYRSDDTSEGVEAATAPSTVARETVLSIPHMASAPGE